VHDASVAAVDDIDVARGFVHGHAAGALKRAFARRRERALEDVAGLGQR
jgi:hypothetical protein